MSYYRYVRHDIVECGVETIEKISSRPLRSHVVRVRAATGVTQQVIKCRYYDLFFIESIVFSHLSVIRDYIPRTLFLDDCFNEECNEFTRILFRKSTHGCF